MDFEIKYLAIGFNLLAMDPLISISHLLNGLLMVAMPIGLGFYLTRRFKLGWQLWWIGAATFAVSQVGHIPFNSVMGQQIQTRLLPSLPQYWRLPVSAIWLGMSAGLWEELARYAAYRWWAKDARSWGKGMLLGAGHGGIEAILLGALVLYTYVQMVAIYPVDLSTVISPDRLAATQQAVKTYWSSPWYLDLLGALERAFAIPTQIALSVLVLQSFIRRQFRWLFMAILFHAAVDAIAYYANLTRGAFAAEGFLAVVALLDLLIIFAFRQAEPAVQPAPELEPLPDIKLPAFSTIDTDSAEELERTRYN